LCTVLICMAMNHMERSSTRIIAQDGEACVQRQEVLGHVYMLTGWQHGEDNAAHMMLRVDESRGLCLYLSVNSGAELFINGSHARTYAVENTLIYQLPEGGEYLLELRSERSNVFLNNNLCLYLGDVGSAISSSQWLTFQRMLIVGIDVAVVLFALTLYVKKRSEKYLLAFMLYALITLFRTSSRAFPGFMDFPLANLFFNIPGLEMDSPAIMDALNTIYRRTWDVIVRYLILRAFVPVKTGKHSYIWYCSGLIAAAAAAVFLVGDVDAVRFVPTVMRAGFHILEMGVLLRGMWYKRANVYPMWIAWVVMMGMWIFDDIASWSIGGTYILGTTVGLAGIYETVLLVGFLLAVNGKFAGKFAEADELTHKLEQTNAGLEQIVAEKTRELQLSYDELQKTQQQKDEMVSNIAHNLKTPLFSMSGYVEMMTEEVAEDNTALREQLGVLQKNMAYVQRRVKDLLLAYRLEGGRIVFHKMKMDLRTMTEQAAELVKARCRENGVKLVTELCDGEASIAGDHFYLLQAVQNVLENAADCGPEGTEVRLGLFSTGERWCISVTDCGKGIAPEDVEHIFERYYSKREDGRRSSGLGLAIARDIVLAHQGEITVKSELGKGAEFMIFLPKAQE